MTGERVSGRLDVQAHGFRELEDVSDGLGRRHGQLVRVGEQLGHAALDEDGGPVQQDDERVEPEQQKDRQLAGPDVVLEVWDVEGQFRQQLLIDTVQVFGHGDESLEGVGRRAVQAPVGVVVQDVGGLSVQMGDSDQLREWLGIAVAIGPPSGDGMAISISQSFRVTGRPVPDEMTRSRK